MSIAIIFNQKAPQQWAAALKKHLPNVAVEIFPNIQNFEAVDMALCWKPDTDVLNLFPNLKLIHSVGAAVDHIIKSQKIKKDQTICRIVDENLSNDMFEFLLAAVMAQIKNLSFYQNQKQQKIWHPKIYKNIKQTQITILGLGEIGTYVTQKFATLGFKVNGWSRSKKNIAGVNSFAGKEELAECLKQTAILINILPVTTETENMINTALLSQLNKDSYLINVGRGEHIVEQDLLMLLDQNHLSAALLDVFRTEPLPENHPFWQHPKIQITPHTASVTQIDSAVLLVVENYQNFLKGLPLKHIASLTKGY